MYMNNITRVTPELYKQFDNTLQILTNALSTYQNIYNLERSC